MHQSPAAALHATLQEAEQFIAGFEDDETQQPAVGHLLARLREQIALINAPAAAPATGAQVQRETAAAVSPLQGEVGNRLASAACHDGLLDADLAKDGIWPAAGAGQIGAAAAVATPSLGVVLRKAPKLVLLLLGLRLRLLGLRSQVLVLALQRPDALTQKGQVLTEHRRRAALVDQRLQFVEKRVKHFILRCPSTADGSYLKGGAA